LKAITIKDVAKEAGISISVVSYVLNNNTSVSISEETKTRVINAAKRLNYTPSRVARSMRTNKSMVIGLATFWNVSDSVFTETLKGVDSIAEKNGYSVTYCNLKNDSSGLKVLELYNQRQIDGVILLANVGLDKNFSEIEFINNVKKSGVPTVIINGITERPDISYVYIDYYGTTYTAVDYLYQLGHRKLCYMLPNKNEIDNMQSVQRIRGYKDALKNLNLIDYDLYLNTESIYDIVDLLSSEDKPTAVVVNKMPYAVQLLKTCVKLGIKVPEDISIIACNDEDYAGYLTPPLVTIKVPICEMGEKSAEILFDAFKNKSLSIKLKLPNKVIERESCRRL